MSPRVLKASENLAPARPRWRRRKPSTAAEIAWVVWPARAHLLRGLAVLAFIAVISVGVDLAMSSRLYATIAFFTLLVAVLPFYLPASYRLDDSGVGVDSLLGRRDKPWVALKVYFPDGERGVLVSSVTRDNLIARTRGLYLPYQGNREQVLALVEKHLQLGSVRSSQ
jgi:hypothetical protein